MLKSPQFLHTYWRRLTLAEATQRKKQLEARSNECVRAQRGHTYGPMTAQRCRGSASGETSRVLPAFLSQPFRAVGADGQAGCRLEAAAVAGEHDS